jgi:hypothetical protein
MTQPPAATPGHVVAPNGGADMTPRRSQPGVCTR